MFSVFCVNKKFSTDKIIQTKTESRTFALLDKKELVRGAGATFDWLFFDNSKLTDFDC